MAGIQGAPAPKPSQLNDPVPGQAEQSELDQFLNSFDAPEMDTGSGGAAPVDAAVPQQEPSELDAFLGEQAAPLMEPLSGEPEFQEVDTTLGVDLDIERQFKDHKFRIAAKIAENPEDTELTLQNMLGKDNVVRKEDIFYIKPPGEEKFRRLDPPTFQIMNDLFSDWYKEAAQIVGGAAGGVVTGGNPLGIVGGVATATAGVRAMEPMLGVVRAEQDSTLKAITDDVSEGMMFAIGEKAAKLAPKGYKALKTKIFGPSAKEAEAKAAEVTANKADEAMHEVAKVAEDLKAAGIDVTSDKMTLTPGQVLGDTIPEAEVLEKSLTTQKAVRQFFIAQGEKFNAAWQTLQQGITNVTGKSSDELFLSLKNITKAERELVGKTIGQFRDQASKAGGNKRLPMQRFQEAGTTLFKELGGRFRPDGTIMRPKVADIMARFKGISKEDATAMANQATVIMRKLSRKNGPGQFTLNEMQGMYNLATRQVDSSMGSEQGRVFAKQFIGIKNAIRDDWRDAMAKVLPEDQVGAYMKQVERFNSFASAQKTLSSLLKQPDMTSAALANKIFSPASSRKNIQAFKALVESENPGLFKELVGQKLDLIVNSATKNGSIDFKALSNTIKSLDSKGVLSEMLPPKDKMILDKFLSLAEKVPPIKFKAGELPGSQKVGMIKWARNLFVTLMPGVSKLAKVSETEKVAARVLGNMDKDNVALKWLNGEGLEIVLKGIPAASRNKARVAMGRMVDEALKIGIQKTSALEAIDTSKDIANRIK